MRPTEWADDLYSAIEEYHRRGWTDGLPVVPPTEERIADFLQAGGLAAVICTEPFRPTVETVAKVRGMANYPVAYIPHPVGSLTEDQLRERAREIAPEIRKLLTG